MDATVDVVDLTEVMPGYRPIAQLYTDSGTAVDRAVCDRDPQPAKILKREYPALRKLLQFRNRGATVKNLDITGTIPARSIKPYARSYVLVEDFRDAVIPEYDRVASAAVNCIARNSPEANRHSRQTRTDPSYLQIYETSQYLNLS